MCRNIGRTSEAISEKKWTNKFALPLPRQMQINLKDIRHNTCRQGMAFAEKQKDNHKMTIKFGLSKITENRLLKKFIAWNVDCFAMGKHKKKGCSKEYCGTQ